MIVVGYQGIGKSSVSRIGSGMIDLESSNFWVDDKRSEDWYVVYCNIAKHLSEQGYLVFTSSHEVVRKQLKKMATDTHLVLCFPGLEIKELWLERLKNRFVETGKEKDFKALVNAMDRYDENIMELMNEDIFDKIVITKIPYDLKKVLFNSGYDTINTIGGNIYDTN